MNDRPNRRSIRLKRFDYSSKGAYFITVCVKDHKCVFGRIAESKMELNAFGMIAWNEWKKTGELRPDIEIDPFVIMPNHLHGIITITGRGTLPRAQNHNEINAGTLQRAPTNTNDESFDNNAGTLPRAQNHDEINAGTLQRAPTTVETFGMPRSGSLSTIVRLFKATTTKMINILRGTPGAEFWQRNYYERVVRNESELNNIRQYIVCNPSQWRHDRENESRVESEEYAKMWEKIL